MSAPIPAIAIVDRNGKVRSLVRGKEPDEHVTKEQVIDVPWMARLLTRILRALAQISRSFTPRRIEFEDVPVDATGTTEYRFVHGFGGRVRWWVVEQDATSALWQSAKTDNVTLVLISAVACTITLRIEEAG